MENQVWNMRDALPEFSITVSAQEAKALARAPHGADEYRCLMALTETLVGRDRKDPTAIILGQLIFFTILPGAPEALALQIAFGRRLGEQNARKIARIRRMARGRGLSVDDYVSDLAAAGAIPRDESVVLFHGEGNRRPVAKRLARGISLLRTTAGVAPLAWRPPLLCALAWMHWATGRRAVAMAYLAEATRIDPENVLAYGLGVMVDSKVPDWLVATRVPE